LQWPDPHQTKSYRLSD